MTLFEQLWNDPLYRLIMQIAIGQVVGLGSLLAFIWALRLRRHHRHRVSERTITDVSTHLFSYLAGTTSLTVLVSQLRKYSVHQRATVLEKYVATLTGKSEADLSRYFERSGMLRAAQRLCRSLFWWRRLEGARLLGAGGYEAGAITLQHLLHDRNLAVRLAAARALGRTQDPKYIAPLLRALRRGRLSRAAIAEVLVTFGPESRQVLRELVMQLPTDSRASKLRATTVEVLALVGDAGATPFIQYALASGDDEVRIAAFKAAGIIRAGLSTDELRAGLSDPVWQVRAHAAGTVGKTQTTRLLPDLAVLLEDRNWWVRTKAAHALFELGKPGIRMLESIADTHMDSYARGMALRVLTEDPVYADLRVLSDQFQGGEMPHQAPATVREDDAQDDAQDTAGPLSAHGSGAKPIEVNTSPMADSRTGNRPATPPPIGTEVG